jgi:hypothetical protein
LDGREGGVDGVDKMRWHPDKLREVGQEEWLLEYEGRSEILLEVSSCLCGGKQAQEGVMIQL